MSGFIKLHRSLSEWEWYSDTNAVRLLIHLLISVNYKDKKWKGRTIKKGSMVLSWDTLSKGCFMSIRQCRTAMEKLIDSGEVTKEVTNKYQVITLVKWDKMQIEDVETTDIKAEKCQADDRQMTTTKERKEIKEEYISDFTFDQFWDKYPKKVAKAKCRPKFEKLKEEEKDKIFETLDNFIEYKPFSSYTHPNPETYLNQKRWEDELPEQKRSTSGLKIGDIEPKSGRPILFFTDEGRPVIQGNTQSPTHYNK